MTSAPGGSVSARTRDADDDLPDSLEPGRSMAGDRKPSPELPKGDVRIASWFALLSGIVVLLWYLSILVFGGVYLGDLSTAAQIVVWVLAAVSLACGIVSLNARCYRELAAAGFIAGVVSLLVSLAIGLPTGIQILF
jgi:hypothetical protein